jgi:hypothetical protein
MEDRAIGDMQLSTSSNLVSDVCSKEGVTGGRLNSNASWCAASDDSSSDHYIEVSFDNKPVRIDSIVTQGNAMKTAWVTSFTISYTTVENSEVNMQTVFVGNTDASSPLQTDFDGAIVVTKIRVHPKTWVGWPSMRLDFFACPAHGIASCTHCENNFFQDAGDGHKELACKATLKACPKGEYFTDGIQRTENTCTMCEGATYIDVSDHRATECDIEPLCVPGEYCDGCGTRIVEPTCETCSIPWDYRPVDVLSLEHRLTECLGKQPPRECSEGEYHHRGNSVLVDDSLCVALGSCPPGFFHNDGLLGFSTSENNLCLDCLDGTFQSFTLPAPLECKKKRKKSCAEGFYLVVGPSVLGDDSLCVPCPDGTYNPTRTDLSDGTCKLKDLPSSCPPGEFVELGDSAVANDNACTACPEQTFKGGDGADVECQAKKVTSCDPGYFLTLGDGAVFDNNICVSCPPGTFQPALGYAENNCISKRNACDNTTYAACGTSTTEDDCACVKPGTCPVGQYVVEEGDVDMSRFASGVACAKCPHGTYSDTPSEAGIIGCLKKHTQWCVAGFHLVRGSSAEADDSTCTSCPAGTWTPTDNDLERCTTKQEMPPTCAAGKYRSSGLRADVDDHTCYTCPSGKYQPVDGSTADVCTQKVTRGGVGELPCPAGMYCLAAGNVVSQPSSTEDDLDKCRPCPQGTWSPGGGPATNTECQTKTMEAACTARGLAFAPSTDPAKDNACINTAQIDCPAGLESTPGLRNGCQSCGPGRYKPPAPTAVEFPGEPDKRDRVLLDSCQAKRRRCPTALEWLVTQPPGSESHVFDDTQCIHIDHCPAGTFRGGLAREWSNTKNHPKCIPCPEGQFGLVGAQTKCTPKSVRSCEVGFYFHTGKGSLYDNNVCIECPAGTYSDDESATGACTPKKLPDSCAIGEFTSTGTSLTADDSGCQACAAGTFSPDRSVRHGCLSKERATCPAGVYFWSGGSKYVDDNVCVPCPPRTFSDADDAAISCRPKTPAVDTCRRGRYFFDGSSATTNDNLCVPMGWCPRGHHIVGSSNAALDVPKCAPCTPGFFQPAEGAATSCQAKSTQVCAAGFVVHNGASTVEDDSECAPCGPGTYVGATFGTARACFIKENRRQSCDPGKHVSPYTSRTTDDWDCVDCPAGHYMESRDHQEDICIAKQRPVSCPAGEFYSEGAGAVRDDWICKPCPAGEFAATSNLAATCTKKLQPTAECPIYTPGDTAIDTSKGGLRFVLSGTATADNQCHKVRVCAAGHQVNDAFYTAAAAGSNASPCTPCEAGTFNDKKTSGKHACKEKRGPWEGTSGALRVIAQRTFMWDVESVEFLNDEKTAIAIEKPITSQPFVHELGGWTCTGETCARNTLLVVAPTCVSKTTSFWFWFPQYSWECSCPPTYNGMGWNWWTRYASHCQQTVHDKLSRKAVYYRHFDWETGGHYTGGDMGGVTAFSVKVKQRGENRAEHGARVERQVIDANGRSVWTTLVELSAEQTLEPEFTVDLLTCPAGKRLFRGADAKSTIRDDWACADCKPGSYSDTDSSSSECKPKGEGVCNTQAGERIKRGTSLMVDDTACLPPNQMVVMCARQHTTATASTVNEIMLGPPARIAPFTRTFRASVLVHGHARVTKTTHVVITGKRFVSNAERVPFPEGRALLILHDPPGGNSFSAFHNVRANSQVKNYEETKSWSNGASNEFTIAPFTDFANDGEHAYAVVAPMGGGFANSLPSPTWEISVNFDWDEENTWGGEKGVERSLELDSFDVTFTYQTSARPDKAGPPSDAFLMPALTFEVVEWWKVVVGKDQCEIFGDTLKNLVPKPQLSAFWFTTANDIETRNIPLLADVAKGLYQRVCCLGHTTLPQITGSSASSTAQPCEEAELASNECCTELDVSMGCVEWDSAGQGQSTEGQKRLEAFCDYKQGADRTSDAWLACFGLDAKIAAQAIAAPEERADRWDAPIEALQNWQDTVARNYRKLDDARAGKWDDTDLEWNQAYSLAPRILLKRDISLPTKFAAAQQQSASKLNGLGGVDTADGVVTATPDWMGFNDNPTDETLSGVYIQAKTSSGAAQTAGAVDKFEGYNTLTFEGGGSKIDYNAALGSNVQMPGFFDDYPGGLPGEINLAGIVNERTVIDKADTYAGQTAVGLDMELKLGVALPFAGDNKNVFSTKPQFVNNRESLYLETTMVNNDDGTHASFHLEDPDYGDYFVVRVFKDPDIGTPLFVLDGGASSCAWEVKTKPRAAPKMEAVYVGPDRPAPDQPALFKVTLGQAENYYEAGPLTPKWRPGWLETDKGYTALDYEFYSNEKSLSDGLYLTTNGRKLGTIRFSKFSKGSVDVIVEVHRGPLEYEYPAPEISWKVACSGGAHPKKVPWYPLRMPYLAESNRPDFPLNKVGVGFPQPCPELIWSGSLLARGTFKATAKSAAVEVQTIFPGWDRPVGSSYNPRPIASIGLQFRRIFGYGPGEWHTSDVEIKDRSPAMWSPPSGEDGTYDVRVVAKCTTATDPPAVDKSETTTVRGVVDRVPPSVVAITSGTGDFSDRWVVTATFSEDVVCRGDNWHLDAKIKVGTGPAPPVTVYVCDGPKLMMALPDQIAPPDSSMAVEVAIESGVRDGAGNDIKPVVIELAVGESLRVAHAMNKSIHTKLDRANTDAKFMQVTLDAILNTVVGAADVAKAEAAKRADEAAAAAERSKEMMEAQEAQRTAAADAAAAAEQEEALAAEEEALAAAEAGVDAAILAELKAERGALKAAKAELVAAKAVSAARHARNARAVASQNVSTALPTPTAGHDLAALQATVNLAERRVRNSEAILDENIAQVVEYMEPGSPVAARLADSQAKLKAATADAKAAAETEAKASVKLAQAEEAQSAADAKAAASKYQASLDFEKSPLATSEGSSSFQAAEAEADTLSNVHRVAAATLAFVLIAIVLIVAVGYKVVVSHNQATLRALSLHKGHPQLGAEQPDGRDTLRVVGGSAHEYDNPAYAAMPTFPAAASSGRKGGDDDTLRRERVSTNWAPGRSVSGLNSPDHANAEEDLSPTTPGSGGSRGYHMAAATDTPRGSITSANQVGPANNDVMRGRSPTAWESGASIVSTPSPNGGPASLAYQLATTHDRHADDDSTEDAALDSVVSLPSPRSNWSKVAGGVRAAAQFAGPTRQLSKISNM